MSADVLKSAIVGELQKQADATATALLNVSTSQTCEQIALYVAGLSASARMLGRVMEIVNAEYVKMTQPEKQKSGPQQKKEMY